MLLEGESKLIAVLEQDFYSKEEIIFVEDWEMKLIPKNDLKALAAKINIIKRAKKLRNKKKI